MEPLDVDLDEGELELPSEPMHLNMGPSHPGDARHRAHRARALRRDDREGRRADRLSAPRLREDVRARHVDAGLPVRRPPATTSRRCSTTWATRWRSRRCCGVTVPERCQWYRMILGELARICDHLTCNGAMAMELGAFTPFLWFVKAREMIWDILEEETGARAHAQLRPRRRHGQAAHRRLQGHRAAPALAAASSQLVDEGEKLLLKNRIFLDRLESVGVDQRRRRDRARVDGPVPALDRRRLRRPQGAPVPEVRRGRLRRPVGTQRRQLDRFIVRLDEIRQCARIIEQALERMADDGPVNSTIRASCCRRKRTSTRPSRARFSTSRS